MDSSQDRLPQLNRDLSNDLIKIYDDSKQVSKPATHSKGTRNTMNSKTTNLLQSKNKGRMSQQDNLRKFRFDTIDSNQNRHSKNSRYEQSLTHQTKDSSSQQNLNDYGMNSGIKRNAGLAAVRTDKTNGSSRLTLQPPSSLMNDSSDAKYGNKTCLPPLVEESNGKRLAVRSSSQEVIRGLKSKSPMQSIQ